MNSFTLHIRDNSQWRVFERFDDRDSAISIASRLRNSEDYTGIKVLEEGRDLSTLEKKKSVIFAWTTKTKEESVNKNTDDYMERRKQSRLQKEKREKIRKMAQRKRIMKASILAIVICGFFVGVATLSILKS